jgi:hypothetical protein
MHRPVVSAIALASCMAAVAPAATADLLERTYLADMRLGSVWSGEVRAAARGGYDLTGGAPVRFRPWYTPDRHSLDVGFLTELGRDTALLWGISTGERGEKYVIRPGLSLGILHRIPLGSMSSVTFRAETMIGGGLRETPCVADFGEIGGVQVTNCRLAATPLQPRETLRYLMRRDGWEATRVAVLFEMAF